jgi:hypothetical protein
MYNKFIDWRDNSFMLKYCLIALIVILSASSARALDTGQKEDCKVFTNKDLEEYKIPSDDTKKTADDVSQKTSKKKKTYYFNKKQMNEEDFRKRKEEAKEERLQKYWCRKGSQYRRKVEKAEMGVKDAEEYLSEVEHDYASASTRSCRRKGAEKGLKLAQQFLKEAEDDLSYIEDEAHRQWIPPGWLRCQF